MPSKQSWSDLDQFIDLSFTSISKNRQISQNI